eukprot:Nk52_evm7s325 gene=Nk52_evmTU7s325
MSSIRKSTRSHNSLIVASSLLLLLLLLLLPITSVQSATKINNKEPEKRSQEKSNINETKENADDNNDNGDNDNNDNGDNDNNDNDNPHDKTHPEPDLEGFFTSGEVIKQMSRVSQQSLVAAKVYRSGIRNDKATVLFVSSSSSGGGGNVLLGLAGQVFARGEEFKGAAGEVIKSGYDKDTEVKTIVTRVKKEFEEKYTKGVENVHLFVTKGKSGDESELVDSVDDFSAMCSATSLEKRLVLREMVLMLMGMSSEEIKALGNENNAEEEEEVDASGTSGTPHRENGKTNNEEEEKEEEVDASGTSGTAHRENGKTNNEEEEKEERRRRRGEDLMWRQKKEEDGVMKQFEDMALDVSEGSEKKKTFLPSLMHAGPITDVEWFRAAVLKRKRRATSKKHNIKEEKPLNAENDQNDKEDAKESVETPTDEAENDENIDTELHDDKRKLDTEKEDTEKPDTEKEDTEKEDTEKPDTEKEDTEKEDTEKSDTEKEDTEKEDTEKPDTEKEDTEKEDTEKPDTEKEDTEKTDTVKKPIPMDDQRANGLIYVVEFLSEIWNLWTSEVEATVLGIEHEDKKSSPPHHSKKKKAHEDEATQEYRKAVTALRDEFVKSINSHREK